MFLRHRTVVVELWLHESIYTVDSVTHITNKFLFAAGSCATSAKPGSVDVKLKPLKLRLFSKRVVNEAYRVTNHSSTRSAVYK